jgi:polyhydroxyalkanoate synthesis regulator phasin
MIDSLEGSGDLNAEGSASAYFAKAIGRENLNYTKETEAELRSRLEQYFRGEGFTEEEASSLASALMSSANMTTQQFIDYMENMVLTSEAAQKYWEQNKERLI